MNKSLRKSNNKIICGVCGGIAEFFNIDATVIRLLMCILTIFMVGTGIIIYIVAAIVMPAAEADNTAEEDSSKLKSAKIKDSEAEKAQSAEKNPPHTDDEFNSYFKKD